MDRRYFSSLLLTFLPASALLIVGAYLFYLNESNSSLNRFLAEEKNHLDLAHSAVINKIESVADDIDFLKNTASFRKAIETSSPEQLGAVEQNFIAFSRSKRVFDQVRWIDETGMEKVRINYNNGKPAPVSKEQLQFKGDRYYFTETEKLSPSEYFVSPFDLNIEKNAIEIPYKPTIRFATTLQTQAGANRGIIILNYIGSELLEEFIAALGESRTNTSLLNNDGYWIYSPNAADEWGFMLNKKDTFALRQPAIWPRINNSKEGQLIAEDGLWVWATIYPTEMVSNLSRHKISKESDENKSGYYWKLVSHVENNAIQSALQPLKKTTIIITLILIALTFGASYLITIVQNARKHIKEALAARAIEETEERFNLLIKSSPNGLLLVSKQGEILRANPQSEIMFGYLANELIGRSVDSLVPSNIFHDHARLRNQYIANPSARKLGTGKDLMAKKKDGSEFFAEISLTPLMIKQELFVLACVVDISERKNADLIQSRLASIVEWSDDAIISKTLDGKIVSWNKGAERLFGYTAEEVVNNSALIIFPTHLKEQEIEILNKISQGISVEHRETQRLHKTGSIFDVSITVSPIQNKNGKIVGASTIARDISEQKRAQEEIKRLNKNLEKTVEERTSQLDRARRDLQNILDAMPSMVGYWDKNLINRFANKAYREWLGIHESQIRGKHIVQIVDEERYQQNLAYMQDALKGMPQIFEQVIQSEDGSYLRHYLNHYIPDIHNNEILGFYVLSHDVTAIKQTEAALRAANQELEAFAYAVSHDLRAPLRAMIGFSQAIEEDCADQLNEEGIDYLQEIKKAARKMGDLIDGLLALSRSTKGELERVEVDLSLIAEKIKSELSTSDSNNEKTICWQIESGLVAHCDPRALEIALRNLLSNAKKYSAKSANPSIHFYAENIEGERYFCVEDNGAGFEMAHSDRLFKPFQRLHRQEEFKGIGIGLATVQRIINRHGGKIFAKAELGKGAKFCFNFGSNND